MKLYPGIHEWVNRKLVEPVPGSCMKRDIFLLVLCHNFSLKYTANYTSNLTTTALLCVTIGHIILRSFDVQQLQLQLPELCSFIVVFLQRKDRQITD